MVNFFNIKRQVVNLSVLLRRVLVRMIVLTQQVIITAAQFSGFSHLIAPHASTKTITVKVASKIDGEHRYYGSGSSNGYVLDNVQSPFLTLTPGRTYRFDVSDSSNSSHPFRFYLDAAKATAYTTGVTVGSGYVDLEVTDSHTYNSSLSVFISWIHG